MNQGKGSLKKKGNILRRCGAVIIVIAAAAYLLPFLLVNENRMTVPALCTPSRVIPHNNINSGENLLKTMTLNIAHGRSNGFHQLFQDSGTMLSNIYSIAEVLEREKPDLAALQEADGPSFWSGSMDQPAWLAEQADFPFCARGEHVCGWNLIYGTAILSRQPLKNPLSVTFAPSPPTFPKGFVVSTVAWPGKPGQYVDVVSVHLDFLRKSVRMKQAGTMIETLSDRGRPLIVMGDFNCEMSSREKTLDMIMEGLHLNAFRGNDSTIKTFPKLNKRFDWILISSDLKFVNYKILPDILSDHLAVTATIALKNEMTNRNPPKAKADIVDDPKGTREIMRQKTP